MHDNVIQLEGIVRNATTHRVDPSQRLEALTSKNRWSALAFEMTLFELIDDPLHALYFLPAAIVNNGNLVKGTAVPSQNRPDGENYDVLTLYVYDPSNNQLLHQYSTITLGKTQITMRNIPEFFTG